MSAVLTIWTKTCDLRTEALGWNCEDPAKYVRGKPIGTTPACGFRHCYATVLEALASGWKLLGPPVPDEDGFSWWLVRDGVLIPACLIPASGS